MFAGSWGTSVELDLEGKLPSSGLAFAKLGLLEWDKVAKRLSDFRFSSLDEIEHPSVGDLKEEDSWEGELENFREPPGSETKGGC